MNFQRLKYFMAVAENLHFSKAAEKLFMAQPPLTRQIKQLEKDLGVQLFKRDKRNVSLTAQGKLLYEESTKIFSQINGITESLKQLESGLIGQITIGYVGAAMHCILPELLVKLKSSYPGIHTVLQELNNEKQVKSLKSGIIDIGFLRTPVKEKGLEVKSVFQEPFSLVVPASFPDTTQLKDLAGEPFISFSKDCGPGLIESIYKVCNKAGFTPKVVHETSQINSIVRLVESGLGYSIVPKSVENGYNLNISFLPIINSNEIAELSLVYNKNQINPMAKNFIELIA